MKTKKTSIEKKEALLRGARIATSDQVINNEFANEVQKELESLKAEKIARVSPRKER